MFYVASSCPICGVGTVGFRCCNDGATLVLMCDECDSVWLSPETITAELAAYPQPPAFLVPGLAVSVTGTAAGWANKGQIQEADWFSFVVGKAPALDEASGGC